MKKIMNVLSLALVLVFVSSAMHAQAGKTNFSGTWAFNAEKSNMGQNAQNAQGGGRGFGGGDMVVKQDGNTLSVATTRPGRNGGEPQTTTMNYTLDGKESVNTSQRGDSKSTATWSPDGSLTVKTTRTMEFNGESRTMNSTEVWKLNGSALTITSTMPSQNGERTFTRVYDKK
ncbi:MAG TPA: hypothetical protein VK155_11930 [Bacteroidales bacterium]|nr:hypothetical protein [Bacteroidales bacterium]